MTEIVARPADELDPVWKALSDPTRRAILDFLRPQPRTTTEIVEEFPHLTRFGVMKHLEGLRQAHLVQTREAGRQRVNSLNVVPIRQIYERWVGPSRNFGPANSFASKRSPRKTARTASRRLRAKEKTGKSETR